MSRLSKVAYTGKLAKEFLLFARDNKAYWLVPLLIVLLVAALLIFTGQTTAPFIYALF